MATHPTDRPEAVCRRLLVALAVAAALAPVSRSAATDQAGSTDPAQVNAGYQKALAEYDAARQQYESVAGPYWISVDEKRKLRNRKRRNGEPIVIDDYVLDQPPVYAGPRRPVDPTAPPRPIPTVKEIPVVKDLLESALAEFQFVPEQPKSEIEFKIAYARVAAKAGLTRTQIVRIYAFESGGDGKYDVQAGLEYDRPGAHAISTALGYNQLLNTNSVELMAENGDKFLAELTKKSATLSGKARIVMERKLDVVRKMIRFAKTVPDVWDMHDALAKKPEGRAIHAMNLDIDVGPLLQTQKLLDSIRFAKTRGVVRELMAAELEMMNLTGDANGYDLVSMAPDLRERIPTSNFFQRGGYERNPIAIRHNTAAKLLAAVDAKMDSESTLPGAKELSAVY